MRVQALGAALSPRSRGPIFGPRLSCSEPWAYYALYCNCKLRW